MAAPSAPAATTPAATTAPAPSLKNKVFVGNLSFQTREDELADEFEEKAGKVVRANIITRGPRSLGYGFVEFETEEAAINAVKVMDKKVLDGRTINVEVAKATPPAPAGEAAASSSGSAAPAAAAGGAGGAGGFRKRPQRGGFRGPAAPGGGAGGFQRGGRQQTGGYTGPQRYRQRRPSGTAGGSSAPAPSGGAPSTGGYVPRNPRQRRNIPKRDSSAEGSSSPSSSRPPRVERPKVQSTTTLFVANIPFSMDDAGLSHVFEKFKVKTAHVVRKPNGRSKGFGFVEFETEADQQAALAALDKTLVDERELSVKVALTPVEAPASESAEGKAPEAKEEKKEEAAH